MELLHSVTFNVAIGTAGINEKNFSIFHGSNHPSVVLAPDYYANSIISLYKQPNSAVAK